MTYTLNGNRPTAIAALDTLPSNFALTPVNQKRPYLTNWQLIDTTRAEIAQHLLSEKADGYGIKLGIPSGGICAIDIDGTAARCKLFDIMGEEEMPITVEFASGKLDRSQYLFTIPPELWATLNTKSDKITNGDTFEEFGFFWNGRQSVLPPSAHPETEGYFWVHSPNDVAIAPLPDKLLEYWLNLITPPSRTKPCLITNTDGLTIPLARLLTKEHRAVLGGTSQGGRNSTGASLARDLIGVATLGSIECDYRGSSYTLIIEGSPEDLFYSYCDGCNPPLSNREAAQIWKSAQQTADGEPCIRDREVLKNCARSYLKDTLPKPDLSIVDNSTNPDQTSTEEPKPEQPAKEKRKIAGDLLLGLAREQTIYFHTADKIAYVDVWIDGNRHTYAVRSKGFRLWLASKYYRATKKGIGSQTLQETLSTLEAIAIFDGETRTVHLRTAEHQGKIYLDLGTDDWKAVEIDSSGWRIISEPPVRFWRPESLLPLPVPVTGGSLDELREFINVDDSSWILIATFLLFCFCPDKTYPILVLSACRGSGKTAAAEILKGLIDPGKAGLIKLQGDTHKLAVAATRRHLMVYDNVSHVTPDQSDDLCRIATGFGYSTRTLHTTDEETTFELTRPQIITAIDALVTRDDLADRVLMAQLPEIPDEARLPQAELNAKVKAARPRILGALLTALSQTLAELPHTKPKSLPRMADYALFAIASEKALGLESGDFIKIFASSREQSRQVVIESSPVGEAIVSLMRDRLVWKGTTSELLNQLEQYTEESTIRSRFWPKASNLFKRQLTRLTPDLKALGILISEKNIHGTKKLTLEKEVKVSPPSPPSPPEQAKPIHSNNLQGGDKGGDTFQGGDTFEGADTNSNLNSSTDNDLTINPNICSGGDTFMGGDTISNPNSSTDNDLTINQNICSGGDTFEGGDKGGDKKTPIATLETTAQQGVPDLGGDGGDENLLLSKSKSYHRTLKVGNRVKYIGTDKVLQKQYAGVLEVHTIANDSYSCLKPNGTGLTSWIEFEDLQLIELAI